ncbi:hypothetical protein BW730_14250 [Tessaracoccus aquimaris]|uniref:YobI-like P-loop NTPase domain-containing protein n=1 Tax=Tessaracoccus aquimaris TaxID=1332264 RepID=A0A1Q2CQV6_9ACTN|nr:hypothetical protein [Tessaracoccus aquimaris]AQP48496.1 hypothetical protein BW730_14250 [Tessaracoccus aquimaris]
MTLDLTTTLQIMDLTPRYREAQHGLYTSALTRSLEADKSGALRLIALTGQFGTGKSSVIDGLLKEGHVQTMKPTVIWLFGPERGVSGDRMAGVSAG